MVHNVKIKLIRITIGILLIAAIIASGALGNLFKPSTVRAFGELAVDFHTINPGDPIFTVFNMLPGDPPEIRPVDVHNGGSVARMVSVKADNITYSGGTPNLDEALEIIIKDSSTPIYGEGSPTNVKTLKEFFDNSSDPNGVQLNIIPSC